MNEEIREALLRLTERRLRVLSAHDTVGRLFAPLMDKVSPTPTRRDLEQRTQGTLSGLSQRMRVMRSSPRPTRKTARSR